MAFMVLALPYLLNRLLTQQEYAIWVLGFQAALYIPMFGLGINQLIIRSVAYNLSRGEKDQVRKSVSAGLGVITLLFCISCVFVLLGGLFITDIAKVSLEMHAAIKEVWFKVGLASSAGLFSLFFFGCFGGIHRYEWESLYRVIISLLFIVGILLVWSSGHRLSPEILANIYFAVIAIGLCMLLARFLTQNAIARPQIRDISKPEIRTYFLGMYGLSVWQIGVLMVSGFDVLIVSRVAFSAVPGYSIALTFPLFLSGAIAAVASPCLPRFSAELSKPGHGQFQQIFLRYQGYLIIFTITVFACFLLIPASLWTYFLKDSADVFMRVFPILLAATCFRIMTVLYGLAIVSANIQHTVILSPLLEGLVNLIFSVVLAYWIGPVGVAIGTLIGSIVCLLLHSLYNIPRTNKNIPLTPLALILPWKV